jgi:hypothetical protein
MQQLVEAALHHQELDMLLMLLPIPVDPGQYLCCHSTAQHSICIPQNITEQHSTTTLCSCNGGLLL